MQILHALALRHKLLYSLTQDFPIVFHRFLNNWPILGLFGSRHISMLLVPCS